MSNTKADISRHFENDFMKLELREGVLIGWYKTGPITLELAKQAVAIRTEFVNHEPALMIAAEQGVRGFTRDARQYLGSAEGMQGLIAGAMVTKSAFASHIANFFIRVAMIKTKIPMRTFSDMDEAINWLKDFKKETESV